MSDPPNRNIPEPDDRDSLPRAPAAPRVTAPSEQPDGPMEPKPPRHLGRVVDPSVEGEDDSPDGLLEHLSPKPPRHLGRVVDPSVEGEDDSPDGLLEHLSPKPPRHMGRVVDPSVAGEDDDPGPRARRSAASGEPRAVPDDPSLRPHAYPPLPPSEVLLDPTEEPPPLPSRRRARPAPSVLSPTMTAVFGTLFGLAGLFAIFALLGRFSPRYPGNAPAVADSAAPAASAAPAPRATTALESLPDFDDDGPAIAGPWRVSDLEKDANIRMVKGQVGLEPFVKTLQKLGVSTKETYRILAAFKGFDAFKRPRKSDEFLVAIDQASKKVKAFEMKVNALEVYQARENDEGLLVGIRLDMKIAQRERTTAVRITGEDLARDLQRGKLRASIASVIDKAFDGRASLGSMPPNSTLRIIVQEKTALGRFAEYDYVEAMEYVSGKPDAKPIRIYRFQDGPRFGYFDQNGREPYKGGWRCPVPGFPITSHFNPKRFHPVLKRIHPHNGTDYGAPTGTPVHATSYGTVDFVGPRGPAGNLVIIKHPGNYESYYMHLVRFASGLKRGDKVETSQIIGFVGTTGRSTGPHLHFGIKKGDKWIDPLSLKLDGDRLVSPSLREAFEKVKADYDRRLDAIALPAPVASGPELVAAAAAPAPAAGGAAEGEEDDDEPAGQDMPPAVKPPQGAENYEDDEELEPSGANDEPIDEEPPR